jgi:uncharacterized membrane protein YgcG
MRRGLGWGGLGWLRGCGLWAVWSGCRERARSGHGSAHSSPPEFLGRLSTARPAPPPPEHSPLPSGIPQEERLRKRAIALSIEEELMLTPWSLTANFQSFKHGRSGALHRRHRKHGTLLTRTHTHAIASSQQRRRIFHRRAHSAHLKEMRAPVPPFAQHPLLPHPPTHPPTHPQQPATSFPLCANSPFCPALTPSVLPPPPNQMPAGASRARRPVRPWRGLLLHPPAAPRQDGDRGARQATSGGGSWGGGFGWGGCRAGGCGCGCWRGADADGYSGRHAEAQAGTLC